MNMFAPLFAIALALSPATYSLEVDHIDDDGHVRTYVIDHGLSEADCLDIKASLVGWRRLTSVQCVVEGQG